MNKNELKEMFSNIKIGDVFYNLHIEGLKENESDDVLQDLARSRGVQFQISINYVNDKKQIVYEVVKPSKKFLNKEGQWSMIQSKKVKNFISEFRIEEE